MDVRRVHPDRVGLESSNGKVRGGSESVKSSLENGKCMLRTLIASRPRFESLINVALPSVLAQVRRPDDIVIVSDRFPFTKDEEAAILRAAGDLPVQVLTNRLSEGAAGAWNTGLQWMWQQGPTGYVAILDDDDEWDPEHLAECERSCAAEPDVVLSGLRVIHQGVEHPREPLLSVTRDDFLAGNPGWQGSNTFVKLSTFIRIGGFWDGMPSTNDRDLAVRLLSLPDLAIAFTGRMTATWHLGVQPDSLSRPGSPEKRDGLFMFLQRHGHLMSAQVRGRFMARARDLFGLELESQPLTENG